MNRAPLLMLMAALCGCGSIGSRGEFSAEVRNGGTGPFRLLENEELGFIGTVSGALVHTSRGAIGRSHAETDFVVYEYAPLRDPLPPRDPALPATGMDPLQFEERRIFRSTTHVVEDERARLGFVAGTELLAPTLAWEAGGVYAPSITHLPDGRFRLYYVTDAGLGAADSSSIDGVFTRVVDSPIFADFDGLGPARSASVIVLPDGTFVLYFGIDGEIFVARSSDGLAFEVVDSDPSTAELDPLPIHAPEGEEITAGVDGGAPVVEVALAAPAAVVTRSATGRTNVRLYYESHASDGTTRIRMAGSFDGFEFERAPIIAYKKGSPRAPSAFIDDDGVTRLSFVLERTGGVAVISAAVLSVTPASIRFDEP